VCNVLSSLNSGRLCTRVVRLHNGGAAGLFGGAAQAYNMSFRGRLRREVVSRQCLDGGTLEIQGWKQLGVADPDVQPKYIRNRPIPEL